VTHLPIHRTKSRAVLGAPARGRPGPFGTWTWDSDDEEPGADADLAQPATSGSEQNP
jgi:hypothetical protein